MRRLIFSKIERFMIDRQMKPFVLREKEATSENDDLDSDDFFEQVKDNK